MPDSRHPAGGPRPAIRQGPPLLAEKARSEALRSTCSPVLEHPACRIRSLLALACSLVAGSLQSCLRIMAPQHWTIDPAHSVVGFHVRHLMISNVHGRFEHWQG